MDKIKLSKEEKKVFWFLMTGQQVPPLGMKYEIYYACIFSLDQKGLVKANFNYNDIINVRATKYGEAYFSMNPSLKNPTDWLTIISVASAVITAISAVIMIFVTIYK